MIKMMMCVVGGMVVISALEHFFGLNTAVAAIGGWVMYLMAKD